MKEQIKDIRVSLFALISGIESLLLHTDSGLSNMMNAWHHLRLARGWMGKALGYFGGENPYPPANNPKDIPPTVDTLPDDLLADWQDAYNEHSPENLAYINAIRAEIARQIDRINPMWLGDENPSEEEVAEGRSYNHLRMCFHSAITELHNSSMSLGFQLEHIRNKAQNTPLEVDKK